MRVVFLSTLSLVFLCACLAETRVKRIIGGYPADEPPEEGNYTLVEITTPESGPSEPLVFTPKDKVVAVVNGVRDTDGTYRFLGIRYAQAPVGRFRFQRPRKMKLKGEIDATKFGPPCPQPTPDNKGFTGKEDCLFLNVFTPQIPSGEGKSAPSLPVMIWIHGGHFRRGSAAQYDPKPLVRKGIVVVTIQYRLGSLGFLSTGNKELPGNVGLFDISAATRWVQEYIQYFGGNPKRLIPAGQGSGASSATMLALNKLTKDALGGIFAMSGSPVSPFSVDKTETKTAEEVSTKSTCGGLQGLKFVRCMQGLPLETILKADNEVQDERQSKEQFPKNLASLTGAAPAEEGAEDVRFLPNFIVESPLELVKKGKFPAIPLLTGVTKEETNTGVKGNFLSQITSKLLSPNFLQAGMFQDLLQANTGLYENKSVNPQLQSLFGNNNYLGFFTKLLTSTLSDVDKIVKHTTDALFNLPAFVTSTLWSKRSNVFMYSFEHVPDRPQSENLLGGLPLVKDMKGEDNTKPTGPAHGDDLAYLFDIRSLDGSELKNPLTSEEDLQVRDHFTTAVAEFARTGQPKVKAGETWPVFSAETGNYMIMKAMPQLAKNFQKCEMGLWTGDTGLLGSPECGVVGAAGKLVTDTLGSAGSTLLKSVDTLGGGLTALTDPLTKPLQGALGLFGRPQAPPAASTRRPATATTTKKPGGLLGLDLFG